MLEHFFLNREIEIYISKNVYLERVDSSKSNAKLLKYSFNSFVKS